MDKKTKEVLELEKEFLSKAIKTNAETSLYEEELITFLEKARKHSYDPELGEEFSEPIIELLSKRIKGAATRKDVKNSKTSKDCKSQIYNTIDKNENEIKNTLRKSAAKIKGEKTHTSFLDILKTDADPETKTEAVKTLGEMKREDIASELIKCLKKEAKHQKEPDYKHYFKTAKGIIAKKGKKAAEIIYNTLNQDGLDKDYEKLLVGCLPEFEPEQLRKGLNRRQKKEIIKKTAKKTYFSDILQSLLRESSTHKDKEHRLSRNCGYTTELDNLTKICEMEGLMKNVNLTSKDGGYSLFLTLTEEAKELLRESFFEKKGIKNLAYELKYLGGVLEDYVPKKDQKKVFTELMRKKADKNEEMPWEKGWVKNPKNYEEVIKKEIVRWPEIYHDKKAESLIEKVKKIGVDTSTGEEALRKKRLKSIEGTRTVLKKEGGVLEDFFQKEKSKEVFKKLIRDKEFLGRWKEIVREPEEYEPILKSHMKKWPRKYSKEKTEELTALVRKTGTDTSAAEEALKTKQRADKFLEMDQALYAEFSSEKPEKQLELQKEFERAAINKIRKRILSTNFKEIKQVFECINDTKEFLDYAEKFGVKAEKANNTYNELLRIGKEKTQDRQREEKRFLRKMEM